jgi:FlaA1/EpsC-like NDP-sugar epimerase
MQLIHNLINLPRIVKQLILIIVDSILIVFGLLIAFSIRLGYWYWPKQEMYYSIELWIIFGAPLIAVPIFSSFGLYHSIVRYIGVKALSKLSQAVTLYALIWGLFGYMAVIVGVPRSVILINWMLTLITIGGSRIVARWIFSNTNVSYNKRKRKVFIYGAGSAGRQLSHALQLSDEYSHIAYIDDSLEKDGIYINNIPVFSFNRALKKIKKGHVNEVLLALPSISRNNRNAIIKKLSQLPIHVKSLPSLSKIAEGKVKINDLLEIDIRDLLGREPAQPNKNLLKTKITNKVVLVTGAGGSIGSELCRQLILLKPKKLILFEVSESSLYFIEQELASIDIPNIEILPVIGSVRDFRRMEVIFNYFEVQTIYHAAAYKHVSLVEYNKSQGVLNNSIGTLLAVEAAISTKVETFVLISTDKAVRPTNVMGATKRIAELVLQAFAKQTHSTCLTMVRFGNVLGSSGSVIPLFKKQIKEGGPVTVTHANVVRYFMTIPEAVELVIQAGAMGQGGDVFVLDMGEPVKIYDLAVKMIQLSGLQVLDENNSDGDIEIKFTGLKYGEKLYEELLVGDNVSETDNKLIMRANEEMIDWDNLKPMLSSLEEASVNNEQEKILKLLKQIVPQFEVKSNV